MKKNFDCVKMKDSIQARLAKEYEGLSEEERWRRVDEKLATSDHPAARKWRALAEAAKAAAKPAQ
jgi:hypothetical protein